MNQQCVTRAHLQHPPSSLDASSLLVWRRSLLPIPRHSSEALLSDDCRLLTWETRWDANVAELRVPGTRMENVRKQLEPGRSGPLPREASTF